jgi:hypothetical protein
MSDHSTSSSSREVAVSFIDGGRRAAAGPAAALQ